MIRLITFLAAISFYAVDSVPSKAQEALPSVALEQRVEAYFQKIYNDHLQQIYKSYHPWGGKATAITVTAIQVTQWKDGSASERGSDVEQFTVDYTILWSSPFHPNGSGYTNARSTYKVAGTRLTLVGRTILKTNAKHTVDNSGEDFLKLAEVAVKFL